MLERYGYRSATGGNADALKSFPPDMTERLAFAKEKAQRTADYWRDFALLPYGEGTKWTLPCRSFTRTSSGTHARTRTGCNAPL